MLPEGFAGEFWKFWLCMKQVNYINVNIFSIISGVAKAEWYLYDAFKYIADRRHNEALVNHGLAIDASLIDDIKWHAICKREKYY